MDVFGPDHEENERLPLSGTTLLRPYPGSETYVSGRVCEEPDCSTILSRYNRDARCWQHEPAHEYLGPVRGRPAAPGRIEDLSALSV